jgi:hypothetical protein
MLRKQSLAENKNNLPQHQRKLPRCTSGEFFLFATCIDKTASLLYPGIYSLLQRAEKEE